jgi:capsular exopolysaccharide synthesis family protein
MGSASWIVSCPPEPESPKLPQSPAGELVRTPAFPYTQALRGIQLEAPGVVPGYARTVAPTPITVGLLRGLLNRWKLALVVGLTVGAICAAAMWYLSPAKFKVAILFKIEPAEPSILLGPNDRGQVANQGEASVFAADQLNLVKSLDVAHEALHDPRIHEKVLDLTGADLENLNVLRGQKDPDAWLQDELKATIPERTDFLTISLSGQHPKELEALLIAVKEAYFKRYVTADRIEKEKEVKNIEDILDRSESKLTEKKTAYYEKIKADLHSNDQQVWQDRQRYALQKYHGRDQQLSELRARLEQAKYKLAGLEHSAMKPAEIHIPDFRVQEEVDRDAKVRAQRDRVNEIVEKMDQLKNRAQNPSSMRNFTRFEAQLKDAEEQLKIVRKKVEEEVTHRMQFRAAGEASLSLAQVKEQIAVLSKQVDEAKEDVEKLRQEAEKVGGRSVDVEVMRSQLDDQERVLKSLRSRKENLAVELQSKKQRVRYIAGPNDPQFPDYKMQAIFIAIAGLLGLVCGVTGVAYREYRAGKINSSAEVTRDLGLRVVGSLPPLSGRLLGGAGGSTRRDVFNQSLLIESIDGIRTMLLCGDQTETKRTLMITSANAREGKTMLASHLAGSIARTGRKTLLIDCDLRRPGIHRLFDVSESPGISEVLRKEISPADAVRPTRLDDLFVLAAGKCDRVAVEALARNDFPELLAELRNEFDFIIIDSCPILPVPDALLISKHVDAVVLSIRPAVSHSASVFAACERLQAMGVPLLGTVVNGDRTHANGLEYKSLLQT